MENLFRKKSPGLAVVLAAKPLLKKGYLSASMIIIYFMKGFVNRV
jgi:hypothetical protein